jgi:putative nucleotidyltransferase with HDIG domain
MLKKIAVAELRVGMHLHELCGSWLGHPLGKRGTVLNDPADLVNLRASGVTHCWIETDTTVEPVMAEADEAHPAPETPRDTEPAPPAPTSAPPPISTSLEDELRHAAALVAQSRRIVKSLFGQARLGRALEVEHCLPLVDEIAASVWRHPSAMTSLVRLKLHDEYTFMHSVAVCALMVALARQLGQDEAQTRAAGLAGLLHDIGKACVPLNVLNKPDKLTREEFSLIATHPVRGHQLLGETGMADGIALDVCLRHHERLDGTGYPHRLADSALSLPARMGAVCDVYDAITSNRPYKTAWDPSESIAQMALWAKNGQFDFTMFQAFVKCLGIYPIGSLVRLESERIGVVVESDSEALLTPKVAVFFSTAAQERIKPVLLDLALPGCGDRVVGRESNRKWGFKQLDEFWAAPQVLHCLAA